MSSWYALFMPVKTPAEIVKKVQTTRSPRLQPSVKQSFEAISVVASPSSPAELGAHLKSEMMKWGPIIKAANIRAE